MPEAVQSPDCCPRADEGSQQESRQTVEQLEGLLGEASGLLQEHHQAYLKYQGLPMNHRFRKSQ